MLTTDQAGKELGVTGEQVLNLIHARAIEAVNVATNPLGRPAWRISREALNRFIEARKTRKAPKPSRRRPVALVHEYV